MFFTFRTLMLGILETVHHQRDPANQTRHRYTTHDNTLRSDTVLHFRFDVFLTIWTGDFFGGITDGNFVCRWNHFGSWHYCWVVHGYGDEKGIDVQLFLNEKGFTFLIFISTLKF